MSEYIANNYHERMMLRCLALARKGSGWVAPNPMVGCVIVKNAKIIAQGYHKAYGGAHAEVEALAKVNLKAQGATLYVNLEPCSHYGKTPPCVAAIIKSGIKKVYVGTSDPHAAVAGNGLAQLTQHGIEVHVGVLQHLCRKLNRVFFFEHENIVNNKIRARPYVIAKWAMSLNGCWTNNNAAEREISGDYAARYTHRLRQAVDAILVGTNTLKQDNPSLTTRRLHKEVNSDPLKIILDSNHKLNPGLNIFKQAEKILYVTNECNPQFNCEQLQVATDDHGKFDVSLLLEKLYARGVRSLLVEGGEKIMTTFFENSLVDEVSTYIAPVIIGGKLNSNLKFKHNYLIGNDLHIKSTIL